VFLPAADIPTFVGEGRVDLGITGRDQVAEAQSDVELLLDLEFGRCKLQVQVPENGPYEDPAQLIGKNICTSFTGLAGEYFEKLERQQGKDAEENSERLEVEVKGGARTGSTRGRLATKIKYVGGSVEAACALGVADGIVDLVGQLSPPPPHGDAALNSKYRVWRDHEGRRPQADRDDPGDHRDPDQVQSP
jgi:ATP phosphoribosyltransferase